MKVLNKVVLGVAAMTLLVACGPSKVSFEKFQEDVRVASAKDPNYVKAVVKGSAKAGIGGLNMEAKFDHVFEKKDSGWEMTKGDAVTGVAALVYVNERAALYAGQENENATYYSGGGFKVELKGDDGTSTYVFDAYGYVTSVKGDGVNVTVKWSK